MTVENLHDAIGQLPSDLVAQVDQLRSGKKKIIPWQRYAAMAACAALVLCASYGITLLSAPKSCETEMMMQDLTGASNQTAMAEAAPMAPMEAPAEAEAGESPAARDEESDMLCRLPTAAASENSTTAAAGTQTHSHGPGQESTIPQEQDAWCGMMTATIFMGDEIHKLEGTEAVALADLLYGLPYSEEKLCPCSPEFTVDIETEALYEVSLGQYFVRYQGKQAELTVEEAAQIQMILNDAGIDN